MRDKTRLVLAVLFLLALSAFFANLSCGYAQVEPLEGKLASVKAALNQAFSAVLDAEKVGANVTRLVDPLNNASVLLTQSGIVLHQGDRAAANVLLDKVVLIVQDVTSSSQYAKEEALTNRQNLFGLNITRAASGILVIAVAVIIWRRFQQEDNRDFSPSRRAVIEQ
jgi:hypothetical protein